MCPACAACGWPQRRGWFGIWLTVGSSEEQAGPALDRLIHGRNGDMEAFSVRVGPDSSFHDALRSEAIEDVRLHGRTYRTLELAHDREGWEGNVYRSVTIGWTDLDSGMLIFVTYEHIAGEPALKRFLVPARILAAAVGRRVLFLRPGIG